jgi:hypothetical protein
MRGEDPRDGGDARRSFKFNRDFNTVLEFKRVLKFLSLGVSDWVLEIQKGAGAAPRARSPRSPFPVAPATPPPPRAPCRTCEQRARVRGLPDAQATGERNRALGAAQHSMCPPFPAKDPLLAPGKAQMQLAGTSPHQAIRI